MSACTKDYDQYFHPYEYLNTYYTKPEEMRYGYQQLVNFWSQIKQKDLRVLEYGGGPVISRLVSACPHVKDFIFAEYLEVNRKAVQDWIDKSPNAFNWKKTFELIVQELEGKEPDQVTKRQEELRQKIRAIVPCDIRAENILDIPANLDVKYGPPYDVVASTFCIEGVAENGQEYKSYVSQLSKLVKHGGYLVMHGVLDETFWMSGSEKFYCLNLTKKLVLESMKEAGLKEIQLDLASSHGPLQELEDLKQSTDLGDLFFASGGV